MKTSIKTIVMLMLLLFLMIGFLIFTGGGEESGEASIEDDILTIGFSQIGAESSWRTAETESIKTTAEELGIDLKFSDAQQKQENQISAIRNFIAQGVDGIILAPRVETGWEVVLTEAKEAGIPVVLVDRGIDVSDDSLYFTEISSDFIFEGKEAGKWLAEELDGVGNIVEIQGTLGASAATDRKIGFENIINQYIYMNIIMSQTGEFTRAKGKEVMEAFLKAEGDNIDAVYAHNDDMALGAIQAIEEYGLVPGEDIIIVSIDGVKAAFEAMVEGKLNVTVECNPLLGPLVFDAIQRAINGESLPKWIRQDDRVFPREIAADVIDERQY
jgi:simple sugar transport system substrate-binding protein